MVLRKLEKLHNSLRDNILKQLLKLRRLNLLSFLFLYFLFLIFYLIFIFLFTFDNFFISIKQVQPGNLSPGLLSVFSFQFYFFIHSISSSPISRYITTIGSSYPPLYSLIGTKLSLLAFIAICNSSSVRIVLGAISERISSLVFVYLCIIP